MFRSWMDGLIVLVLFGGVLTLTVGRGGKIARVFQYVGLVIFVFAAMLFAILVRGGEMD